METDFFEYSVDHHLDPRRVKEGLGLIQQFFQAELNMPGCVGVEGPTFVPGHEYPIYRTSTRWNNVESFIAWMDSAERRRLLEDGSNAGYSFNGSMNWRGYSQWIHASGGENTPTWKMNLIVLLTLYPSILLIQAVQRGWPGYPPTTLLIGNIASVSLTGWLLVPWASRVYGQWLRGDRNTRWQLIYISSIIGLLFLAWIIAHWILI